MKKLYGYQQRVVTALYERDALQVVVGMGGGKTVCALTAIQELIHNGEIKRAIVLAPKKVAQLVWAQEVDRWPHLAGLRVVRVQGGVQARNAALFGADAHVYVIGIDNAAWLAEVLTAMPGHFDLICIDELSRLKNPKSKRAKALDGIMGQFRIRWGLTGTPRPNSLQDQFKPLSLLSLNALWGKSFYGWRDRNFYPTDYMRYNWAVKPNSEAQLEADINTMTIAVGEADMPDLPELTQIFHEVELPPEVRINYRAMETHLAAEIEAIEVGAANSAVSVGKLAQIAQGFIYTEDGRGISLHSEKFETLLELATSLADEAEPLLVVYEYREDYARLAGAFPHAGHLGSGVSAAETERVEADWNAGKLPLLLIHPASAGHGLNLQHGGRHLVWYSLPWSAELYDQTRKRFWRPGQTRHCFEHFIMATDTVDQQKFARVVQKLSLQDSFKRGLKVA